MVSSNRVPVSYSFPSVTFNETVVGPLPLVTEHRNTIGVAGVFAKGPTLARITSRQQFIKLYGENGSSGSIFVQQAMAQGATNFVISRVLPSSQSATGSISFQNPISPTIIEPSVGLDDTDRTIGFNLEVDFISDLILPPGEVLGGNVKFAENLILSPTGALEDFQGIGFFDFTVLEKIDATGSPLLTSTAAIANYADVDVTTLGENVHLLLLSKDDVNPEAYAKAIKPGYLVQITDGEVAPTSVTAKALSYAFTYDNDFYGVYVKVDFATAGLSNATSLSLTELEQASGSNFIIGYRFRARDSEVLSANAIQPEDYLSIGNYLGFLTVKDDVYTPNLVKPIYFDTADNVLKEGAVNIQFTVTGVDPLSPFDLVLGAQFSVSFVYISALIGGDTLSHKSAFKPGTSGGDVIRAIQRAIYNNPLMSALFSRVTINLATLPYTLSFSTLDRASYTNRIGYKLTQYTGSGVQEDDILYGGSGTSTRYGRHYKMVGGTDGLAPAKLYLYDIKGNPVVLIEAIAGGPAGNNLNVTVVPGVNGQFNLYIYQKVNGLFTNRQSAPEHMTLNNYTVEPRTGLYPQCIDSRYVKVYFLPVLQNLVTDESVYELQPMRTAPILNTVPVDEIENPFHPNHRGATYLKNIYLTGGSNGSRAGTAITDADYRQAINRLESQDCAIIAAPGVYLGDVRFANAISTLIGQAESSSTYNGLRIAVVALARGINPDRAEMLAAGNRSDRAVIIANWALIPTTPTRINGAVSPEGYYAGKVAALSPHISPAAIDAGGVLGLTGLDLSYSLEDLDKFTKAGIEVLQFDPGLSAIKFLNGRSADISLDNKWISVRRQADHMIMNLYKTLQWAKSQNNTADLRSKVAAACNAYMKSEAYKGHISSYNSTICDGSNNTIEDIARGRLNVLISYVPVFPADNINVDMYRVVTNEFGIDLGQ